LQVGRVFNLFHLGLCDAVTSGTPSAITIAPSYTVAHRTLSTCRSFVVTTTGDTEGTVIPVFFSFSRASGDGSISISLMADETASAIVIVVTISLAELKTMLAEAIHVQRLEFFGCSKVLASIYFGFSGIV